MFRKSAIATLVLFLFTGFMFNAFSQEKKPKLDDRTVQRIERQMQSMTDALKLTKDQQTKIRAILEKNTISFDRSKMRDMSREERMDMMQEFRAQRDKTNKEIEKILTKVQIKKFKVYLEKQGSRRRGRGRSRG